jgi:hypothetical protein
MQLVDEHDDVRVLGELLHDRLEALFELPAILGAGDDQRDVERQDPLVGEEVRHVAVDDFLRETFHDRGLADAGLADEHRVVLRAAAEHLLHALELIVAADERIELVLHGRFRQVAAELGQERGLLHARERGLLVQELDDVFPYGMQPHPLLHQDAGGHGPFFAEDAEQQVLGADVVVEQAIRFLCGKLQDALRLRTERDLDGG